MLRPRRPRENSCNKSAGDGAGNRVQSARFSVHRLCEQQDDGWIHRPRFEGKIQNPLVFQPLEAAAESPISVSARANGYDATILIDICNAILAASADGKLSAARYDKMIEQARIITAASAKNGIRQLVYALAGYSPSTDEVIAALKLHIQEEARKYEPEFPNELYMEWHRLYNLAVPDRGKPWQFKHLTVRHVYYPLARSSGKILTLLRALNAKGGDQNKKLFQFLNTIGARALRIQLGRVLEMAESSPNKTEYEKKIMDRFGGQKELDLLLPTPSIEPPPPSAQLRLDLRRQLLSAGSSPLSAKRLGSFVLTRIAHVFLDLTSQNLGDADRVGDCIGGSFLALWSLRHVALRVA